MYNPIEEYRKIYGDDVYDNLNKEHKDKRIISKELQWKGTITGLWLPTNKEKKRNRNLWQVTWDNGNTGIIELEDKDIKEDKDLVIIPRENYYYTCECGSDTFVKVYNVYLEKVKVGVSYIKGGERDGEELWDVEDHGIAKTHPVGYRCYECGMDAQELTDGL